MTARETTYEEMKKAIDEMFARKMEGFLKELETQIRQIGPVSGREISARTIDGWLRRAESQGKLDVGSLNSAAYEVWKVLIEAGARISLHDECHIVPIPNIHEKLARSIEEHFRTKNDTALKR